MELAARGARDDDECEEPVAHSAERYLLRRQARRIRVRASVIGAALTGMAWWVLRTMGG